MRHNLYLHPKKDTPDELKRTGTPVLVTVVSIKRKGKLYCVELLDEDLCKMYTVEVNHKPDCYIGEKVTLYRDDIDADGEFATDL